MAQRAVGKAKRGTAAGVGRKTGSSRDTVADPRERIRMLEAELTRVKAELAAALAHNKVLQENHDQVRNRIDWVIDSLHNLMEK